jgi:hypothetical protein
MNKGLFSKLLPHIIAVVIFIVVAVLYCKPVLQGMVLHQEDVVQWEAMAKNSFDYKGTHNHFPLWTNGMFSGMPAYQIAMEGDVPTSPFVFLKIFTLGLPKPIAFFFLACICFYFLTQVLKINPYVGIFGALAYAYATYNPVIIVVGHETKMWSIALLPSVVASVILIYEGKYWLGAVLTALMTGLLIGMNHVQIVYYTLMILFAITSAYVVNWIRKGEIKHLFLSGIIVLLAGVTAVCINAVQILTTLDAAKTSIRGGSELADKNSSTTKSGLSQEYALSYSMYKSEPFVMMVPNMYGGSSALITDKIADSKTADALQSMPPQLANQIAGAASAYWGGIGNITSGPPYVGAIICFLALLGFFILDSKHKWWILVLTVLTLLMSWGEYFKGFNTFLLNTLPGYNKFRAPSMIIVIPTFLFGMMAVMTIQKIISTENRAELWSRYKKGLLLTAGLFVVLLLIYFNSDFTNEIDKNLSRQVNGAASEIQNYIHQFLNAVKSDRKSLFMSSLGRSFLFIVIAAVSLWLIIKKAIQPKWLLAAVGLFSFIDIITVDTKYLNDEHFQEKDVQENSLQPTAADLKIMQDKSFYRVFDLRQGAAATLTYGARPTAYFHKSIGGYHPAKLSIYQDLIEKQLSRPNIEQELFVNPGSIPVVNMLNTKYTIQALQGGADSVEINPSNLGAVWFVNAVKYESSPTAVMNALTNFNPKDTAIVLAKDQKLVSYSPAANADDSIWLIKNDNDEVTYKYNASSNRFAVFSEVFYDLGWKAYIDGKEKPIIRTNYVLRGLSVPPGQHEIVFKFRPTAFYGGEKLATIAGIILWLLVIAVIVVEYLQRKKTINK